ncbi:uncharacterized protein LY89DRAFT_783214 [Mollisia scopiformis]|uniref:SnoaL-like domain-containing protein n=1 Tax=Mollisia scopiformis TaxID=149040 RepID=A0A194X721_MOLSC|nr:uncharacterized protein LY89DRAFT_783214 [Mollisia scopiformis]KUJ15973.1 hypothetical protein LY89DRAFT_783214 [Mollisia scopiformis]
MGSIPPGSAAPSKAALLRKNATAAVESYNSWNIETILAPRHETATHEILPKSLNRPIMNNNTYRSYFSAIMPYFWNFTVTINDLLVDAEQNKVVVWARSTAMTEIGEYANEYMLMFFFDERGEKIVRSLEFVDSKVTGPYMEELGRFIREKKGSDGFERRYGN